MERMVAVEAAWARKFAEGKMFERFTCNGCRASYNFGQSPRASRVPRCPVCGSLEAHEAAA